MSTIDDLIKIIKQGSQKNKYKLQVFNNFKNRPKVDLDLIRLAYDFAADAHKGQLRKSGIPYINHPLETAITLAQMGMDQDTIIAGLLHDVPEDTHFTLVDIEKNFGSGVAKLVTGITKLGVLKYRGIEKYAENLRKMFISMAQDVRIIIIKMADRINNLKTLESLPPEKRLRIAKESLDIYAPIANRLGMGQIKGEIEDLAFSYVYPEEYAWMKKEVMPKIELRMEYIEKVIKIIKKELSAKKIKFYSVHGRPKRLFSLYKKLIKPHYNREIGKIYDLAAVRVIVDDVSGCYSVLGALHDLWKPMPGRIKDYIAQPKPNGYQSLHTTVFCVDGKLAEIQIRTKEMDAQAEFGIAAHWQYKENVKNIDTTKKGYTSPKKLKWVQDLVQWQKDIADNEQFLNSLTLDVFQNRIFVFTPQGDVIDLPEEATPVDFAYHVHSWIGDHCTSAKVNNQIATLDRKLKNGDIIEITTDKNRKGPSHDWLKFVKTHAAKSKIRSNSSRH
ncbi:MAG: bifunctional (p)ppGpp synthetase/guanosine-3',5'-bis(diphosphate) 3'-pyrophosphohydrolase [Candidatus Buchananbacteria bacterium]|nr:bifunctional (p)ppGpp synthetase/guanosine-3',5'-bis(diphosphate) 3'-pyrophosphohydrolase [Candidatus Buchananbacteria bacterium]